jgi:hypothetical protein
MAYFKLYLTVHTAKQLSLALLNQGSTADGTSRCQQCGALVDPRAWNRCVKNRQPTLRVTRI